VGNMSQEKRAEALIGITAAFEKFKLSIMRQEDVTSIEWVQKRDTVMYEMGSPDSRSTPLFGGLKSFEVRINQPTMNIPANKP